MEKLLKITLGDWSQDGHGAYKEVLIKSNYDVHAVRQAYKDSCKKTGLCFNHSKDYTGLNLEDDSPRLIWTEFEDSQISDEAKEILKKFNINVNSETDFYFSRKKAASLIMKFISLSMPDDFKYEFFEDVEPINGWWNNELNVQLGYGLFC